MTSTNFTVGLDGTRVSSKVIKPPGGGSSDIFGLGTNQLSSNPESKKEHSNTQTRLFGSDTDTKSVTPVPVNRNRSNVLTNENQSLSAKKKYVRRNPITGEGIEYADDDKSEIEVKSDMKNENDEKNEVENQPQAPTRIIQTSIRVRNPPGGKSSGIF